MATNMNDDATEPAAVGAADLVASAGLYAGGAYVVAYLYLGSYLAVFGAASLLGHAPPVDVIMRSFMAFTALMTALVGAYVLSRARHVGRKAQLVVDGTGVLALLQLVAVLMTEDRLSRFGLVILFDSTMGAFTAFGAGQVALSSRRPDRKLARVASAVFVALVVLPVLAGRRDGLIDRVTHFAERPHALVRGSTKELPILLVTPPAVFCVSEVGSEKFAIRPVSWSDVVFLKTSASLEMLRR